MNLNIERLGQGEKIAAGSALALLICMFLSWFNFSYTASNAWESLHYISPILAISIVATLGVAFSEAREMSIGDIPGGLTIFVLGCLSALLILFRLIDPISTPGIEGGSTSGSVEAGAFLGFFAALGIAAGGYVATDGKAVDRLKALLPNGSAATGGFPPAPPSRAPTPVAPPTPAPASPPPAVHGRSEGDDAQTGPIAAPDSPPATASAAPLAQSYPPSGSESPTAPDVPETPTEPDLPSEASEESTNADARSVFCEGCGAPLRAQDRFCRKCGHKQAQVPVSQS